MPTCEKYIPTDQDRLNFLQHLTNRNEYTGCVVLRESSYSRGWRLHESGKLGAVQDVREAIDNYIEETEWTP